MAGTPTVYVICDQNCKWEGMTKEQIIAAIAEATGNTPTGIDDAFITKIKETNAGGKIKFWTGTTAQFNAINTKDDDTLYIITDDDSADSWDEIAEAVADIDAEVTKIKDGTTVVASAINAQYASEDHAKGTIEERLTALGFNQGSCSINSYAFEMTAAGETLTGITKNYICKQGKFVYGRVEGTRRVTDLYYFSDDPLFTIPEGFRIGGTTETRIGNSNYFPCVVKVRASSSALTTVAAYARIDSDGKVYVFDDNKNENSWGNIGSMIFHYFDVIFGYQID